MSVSVARLAELSDRLRTAQKMLIETAALADAVPPENVIRRIADLEAAIVAVDTLIAEEREAGR